MKNTFTILGLLTGLTLQGQNLVVPRDTDLVMDIFAVAPRDLNGAGFGMGIFSPALPLGPSFMNSALRIGGDFYISSMDHRTIKNVPLLAPQSGDAKVRLSQTLMGFNAVARLSLPWSVKVSPYIDGFIGLRTMHAGITITPNQYQPGYESSTGDILSSHATLHYGWAAGMLVSVHRDIKINAGVVYSHSDRPGTIDNIRTAVSENGGLLMDKQNISKGIWLLKLGVSFRISGTNKSGCKCSCDCCHSQSGTTTITTPGIRSLPANRIMTGPRILR